MVAGAGGASVEAGALGVGIGVGVGVSDGVGVGVGVGVSVAEGVAGCVDRDAAGDEATAKVGCGFGGDVAAPNAMPAVPITRLPMRRAATPSPVAVPNHRVRRLRIHPKRPVPNATKLMNQRAAPTPPLKAPRRPSSKRTKSPIQKDGPGRSANIRWMGAVG